MDGVLRRKLNHYTLFVRTLHMEDCRYMLANIFEEKDPQKVSSIFEQNKFARMNAKVPYILETCQ